MGETGGRLAQPHPSTRVHDRGFQVIEVDPFAANIAVATTMRVSIRVFLVAMGCRDQDRVPHGKLFAGLQSSQARQRRDG